LTAAPPAAPATPVVTVAARLIVLPTLRTVPPTTLMMTPGLDSLSLQTALITAVYPLNAKLTAATK
jgi:hypothetical protein